MLLFQRVSASRSVIVMRERMWTHRVEQGGICALVHSFFVQLSMLLPAWALACCNPSLCTLSPYRTNTHLLYSFLTDRGMLSNRLPPCPPSSSWLQPPLPRHCFSSAARRTILLSTSCGRPSAASCPATPPLTLRDSWRAIL